MTFIFPNDEDFDEDDNWWGDEEDSELDDDEHYFSDDWLGYRDEFDYPDEDRPY